MVRATERSIEPVGLGDDRPRLSSPSTLPTVSQRCGGDPRGDLACPRTTCRRRSRTGVRTHTRPRFACDDDRCRSARQRARSSRLHLQRRCRHADHVTDLRGELAWFFRSRRPARRAESLPCRGRGSMRGRRRARPPRSSIPLQHRGVIAALRPRPSALPEPARDHQQAPGRQPVLRPAARPRRHLDDALPAPVPSFVAERDEQDEPVAQDEERDLRISSVLPVERERHDAARPNRSRRADRDVVRRAGARGRCAAVDPVPGFPGRRSSIRRPPMKLGVAAGDVASATRTNGPRARPSTTPSR